MINWIKDNFGFKNIIILVIVILVIAGIVSGPSIYKKIKMMQYKGVAKGEITSVVDKRTAVQNVQGINEKIIGYQVSYIFFLGIKIYTGTEVLDPNPETKLLFDEFRSGKIRNIEIKYSLKNPSENYVSDFKKKE